MELVLTAVIATLLGGIGRVFAAAWAAIFLALLQSFSILIIASRWQNLLLYGFLFAAILLFPRGVRLPRLLSLRPSYNLVIGYGGLSTVAHPIYFAIGAYTTGLMSIHTPDLPHVVNVVAGMAVAVVASVLLAVSALRVSGDYLLIASLGFQLGLLQWIRNTEWMGGPGGLAQIPSTIVGPMRGPLYLLISVAAAAACVLAIRAIVNGPYGRAINAMRDEEIAFTALGRNAMSMKIAIFAIGCGMAGGAGGLYAYYFQYVSPEQFEVLASAQVLTMVVLGGMGTAFGPVVGALLLLAIPQAITFLQLPPSIMAPLQGIIFTVLVLMFLYLRPSGILGGKGRTL